MEILKTINGVDYKYNIFYRYKKNGKRREINSPCEALKAKQSYFKLLLRPRIDEALPPYVVGFRNGYNLKKNGEQHKGKKWVVNLDIKNFFPSITKEMLEKELIVFKDLLLAHGYNYSDFIEFVILNKALPQGSPISPLLSNYIGYKLIDSKIYPFLQGRFGSDLGYTRYADDITISLDQLETRTQVKDVVNEVIKIIESDGLFFINKEKISIMHNSQKQVVTGICVNQKTSLGRKEKLKYRAIFHKLKNNEIKMDNVLQGKIAYLRSIEPEYYEKLKRSF